MPLPHPMRHIGPPSLARLPSSAGSGSPPPLRRRLDEANDRAELELLTGANSDAALPVSASVEVPTPSVHVSAVRALVVRTLVASALVVNLVVVSSSRAASSVGRRRMRWDPLH